MERIKQAEKYVRECLADGRIIKRTEEIVIKTYLRNMEESLSLAQTLQEANGSVLWTVVTSYYAMFYAGSAALCRAGYRLRGPNRHKTLTEALIALLRNKVEQYLLEGFEDVAEQALSLIELLEYERRKRGMIQYETTEEIKQAQAKTSFMRATEFCMVLEGVATKPFRA